MRNINRITLISALALCCFSCRTPKVLTYHKKVSDTVYITDESKSNELFQTSAFILDPTAGSNKTITDLSPEGQAALIKAIGEKTKTPSELFAALAAPIKETVTNRDLIGSNTWKKRVVLNITKIDKSAANRLQNILFTLDIPQSLDDEVEFLSWDKIITETQVVDLGKITAGNSTTLSFSPEIAMTGKIVGAAPGSVSSTSTFNEEKSFNKRFAALNAALVSKSKFQIFRQALANEDISGNIVAEFSIRSKKVKEYTILNFNGLYEGNTVVADPAKVTFIRTVVVLPDFGGKNEVPLDLSYTYRYRKAINGDRTEPEFDDAITYLDGTITSATKLIIFGTDDIEKNKTWEISDGKNYLTLKKNNSMETILFENSSKAQQFLKWIIDTQNLSVSDYQLYLGLSPLQKANINGLKINLSKN